MNDEREVEGRASVSDGNANGIVRCPICEGLHPVKLDRNGNPYFTLSCVGAGSNVFPRTAYGKEKLGEWREAALSSNSPVPLSAAVSEATEPSLPSGSGLGLEPPSANLETALSRFLEKKREAPP